MGPLSERMRDVLAAVADGEVTAGGFWQRHGLVRSTLRALARRGLIEPLNAEWPQLTDEGRAELDRIHAGSAS